MGGVRVRTRNDANTALIYATLKEMHCKKFSQMNLIRGGFFSIALAKTLNCHKHIYIYICNYT